MTALLIRLIFILHIALYVEHQTGNLGKPNFKIGMTRQGNITPNLCLRNVNGLAARIINQSRTLLRPPSVLTNADMVGENFNKYLSQTQIKTKCCYVAAVVVFVGW